MNLQHSADRRRTTLVVTAGVAALAMLAWLAVGQTRAIFSGVTSNTDNSLGTGSVTLENNRGTALFDLSGMLPGSTSTQTIQIINPSQASMGLRLFGEGFATDNDGDDTNGAGATDIADYLDLTVSVDSPDGDKTVFEGTLEEFAAALDYDGGWWTCKATPDTCPHQPIDEETGPGEPEPAWVGLLERTLRQVIPDDVENREELADFWDAVKAVDTATEAQQRQAEDTVNNPPSPEPTVPPTPTPTPVPTPTGSPSPLPTPTENPEPPTLAELWGQVPSELKDELPGPIRDAIETVVNGGGSEPASAMAADDGGFGAMAAASTPSDRGDRINAQFEPWSIRTYTFTVTMAADAGESENVGPNHRASITFVWEGRA